MRAVDELIPGRRWLDIQRCGGIQIHDPGERYSCHEPISTALLSAAAEIGLTTAAEAGVTAAGTAAAGAGTVAALGAPVTAAELGTTLGFGLGTGTTAAATIGSYLPSLATVGTAASVAGTGISVKAGLDQSAYQAAVARYEAQQLADKAGQEAAAGEQSAIQRQRQADYVSSRGRAIAASTGGGATDPTVLDIDTQLAEQGKYNVLSSLYEGMSGARTANQQANIDLFRASGVESAAPLAAAGTVLAGLGTFADKRSRARLIASNPSYAAFA